jgi:hypothetical protein
MQKGIIHTFILVLVLTIPFVFSDCGIYSFKGGRFDPNIKSFTVYPFSNQANIVVPSLADDLTEKLKDKIRSEMNLIHVDNDGDVVFDGVVIDYRTGPSSVTSGEVAATTRLSITVKVNYENKFNSDQNYNVNFSSYVDYDSAEDLASIEDELIDEISEMLIQDIFNRAVNNW